MYLTKFHYVPLSAELLFGAKLSSDPGPLFFPPSHQSSDEVSTGSVATGYCDIQIVRSMRQRVATLPEETSCSASISFQDAAI